MKKIFFSCAIALASLSASAITPLWLRNVKISPDGKNIAFTYKGDIYTVPVNGGSAVRLTSQPSYETSPIWSPDSKSIAFSSDRNGNFDIFIMPAQGGTAKRLTTHSANETPETFSHDGKYVLFSAAIQDPAKSVQFPYGGFTELYKVPVTGGKSQQVTAAVIEMPSIAKDGSWMVYQDNKGFENEWRKHHTSSVTRDIWRYDVKEGKYTNLTNRGGEDRNPIIGEDGKTIYFLSERDGKSMNVFSFDIANPAQVKQLTNFKTHPVRFLSRAENGVMAFTFDGEIYTLSADGKKVAKVNIDVVVDDAPQMTRISTSPQSISVSPDGKQIAYTSRGDVFVASVEHSSVKQVTKTPEAESHLSWSSDGKKLAYTSERNNQWNIYTVEMKHEDPYFSVATTLDEKPLFSLNDKTERCRPQFSPDGKKMAYIQDRDKLMIMDIKSGKSRQLTDGSLVPYQGRGFSYYWSPDSKWILTEIVDNMHAPYTDIAVINTETGEVHNLTQSGYTDSNPRWVLDGNAIVYQSEIYGMRNHASWGSQEDIFIIFLNREAYDKFCLNEEDYEIYKEQQKNKDKADKKDKDTKDSKDPKEDKKEKVGDSNVKDIVMEFDGIDNRRIRLTEFSSGIVDMIITKDGETLYYITSTDTSEDLWKTTLRKKETKMVSKKIGWGGFEMDKDGKIYVLGKNIKKLDSKSDKLTSVTVGTNQDIDLTAERDYMFEYVKREEGARFYNLNMHGVNWEKMTADYRKFMPHINNNYDFAELLSELLGELNVSHTGSSYRSRASKTADNTASFGLLYDLNYTGEGMKVDEIIAGGPFDKSWSKITPGCIITKVNGITLTADADHSAIFNNISGKKTLVTFISAADGSEIEEVIAPISIREERSLLYNRWVKNRAEDVKRWSNGRLGYVHIASMNDNSFRPIYSDILGKYNKCEGIVIDIRHNGGGRMHEDIEVLFSGKKYLTQVARGKASCDMPSRRWNKPSIMVQCEACYSNAHGTPWVYKHTGIGKLVGMPVPGTMTSVNWVTMQDSSMVFGIPVIGYQLEDGSYLENKQLEPDVLVPTNPTDIMNGEDAQLHKAVEVLLHDIDAEKR
ncbi:MAG: S41 family peptidase [Muribaculaceae bacterium]